MIVLKFGGTSVGSPERIREVASLIDGIDDERIVVLSAMAGTTNSLADIAACLYNKKHQEAADLIKSLENKYYQVIGDLFQSNVYIEKSNDLIQAHFDYISSFTIDLFTAYEEKAILAQGELLSSALMHLYLEEKGIESVLMPALNFMRIDREGEPDMYYIRENLNRELGLHKDQKLFITQGFICRDAFGEIDNLKRGGSDYSATLIGVAALADEIQIWTDIDGMHNNDPRIVPNTRPLTNLSYDEAAELAYFGAKILHPSSVMPAKLAEIPVLLKNTLDPSARGTVISGEPLSEGIRAVAAKDYITAINIISGRMLMAYGFLRKVFEIFEYYKTPIDMITTSEVSVSVTIDNTTHLAEISEELKAFGHVEVEQDLTIICVVGEFSNESKGYASLVFDAVSNIPIRMISCGGSRHNISMLVKTDHKVDAMVSLHKRLFENA